MALFTILLIMLVSCIIGVILTILIDEIFLLWSLADVITLLL